MRRTKSAALLLLICGVILTGCQSGQTGSSTAGKAGETAKKEEKTTTLNIFYSGEDAKWVSTMEELRESFMSEYPHIELNMAHSEAGIYTEDLKVREATDDFPDIFELQNPYTFWKAEKLGELPLEVTDLVEEPVLIEGKAYAAPSYTTSYGIIYNQVIFKKYGLEVPKTFEDFQKICSVLADHGVTPLAVGGSKSDNLSYWLNYFFQTDVISRIPDWQEKRNEGKVSFQGAEAKQMLKDYQTLMSGKYILEDSVNMNDNQIVSQMIEGNIAMMYTGPWMFSQIIDAYPDAVSSDKDSLGEKLEIDPVTCRVGWFFMPDEEGNPVVINESGAEWGISGECAEDREKREAMITFFQYFYRKSVYKDVLQSMYAIPSTKEAVMYASPGVQQGLLVDYRYAVKTASYLGSNQTPEGFDVAMYKMLKSVATGVMSVDTAAAKLDESWDEYRGS